VDGEAPKNNEGDVGPLIRVPLAICRVYSEESLCIFGYTMRYNVEQAPHRSSYLRRLGGNTESMN
jgi:hypothetical protein